MHLSLLLPFLHALPAHPFRMFVEDDKPDEPSPDSYTNARGERVRDVEYAAEHLAIRLHIILSPGHTVHMGHVRPRSRHPARP